MKTLNLNKLIWIFCITVLCVACKDETTNSKYKLTASIKQKQNPTWAEKLGWPAGKKVIILHADDVGMCPEANDAVLKLLHQNQIQSSSVMIPCPNSEDFINWAKQHPKMDIGLHLTLTSEWKTYRWRTLAKATEVPGLLDENQKMWHEVIQVVQHASAEEVETEIRAQINQSIAWGYKPSHIDTHMGTLYGKPSYIKVFTKIAQEYGIPANVIDLSKPEVLENFKKKGYPLNDSAVKIVEDYKLPKLDFFTSAPNTKTYEEKVSSFKNLIQNLKPGLTEIIFHPSTLTENLKTITNSWQQRVWEAKMFSDPDLIRFFEQEGIIFTNWKTIMSRYNKFETKDKF
ncbi:polysaccharide deacetylase family protein [Yeosuana marina]|uniref:polysaccharide deacetylase family protein n=1 Tax=Yeosuana marina TaxID=1565536 RepID=UPI0030C8CBAA